MAGMRSILKWFFRLALLAILALFFVWLAIRIPRAYYRRQALQPPTSFVVENAPVIALVHARVIDGTGAAPLEDQTVVINAGRIVALGPAPTISIPAGARTIDLQGKTIIPGLVMMHEHMYTTSSSIRAMLHHQARLQAENVPYPLMYLAAGVTTARTAGSIDGEADLTLKHAIDTAQRPGPDLDTTAPYLEGKPALADGFYFHQMRLLSGPEDAKQSVDNWAARGMTSFKAYMNITPDELKAAIDEAHAKGLKLTGHLCSVGFTEAADMGIDDFEHGLAVDTEFDPAKQPGVCPRDAGEKYFDETLDVKSAPVQALIHHLVEKHVAVTSTMAVFEDFSGHFQPLDEMRDREERVMGLRTWLRYRLARWGEAKHPLSRTLAKEMEFERDFAAAGGLLLAGCDPTGDGGTLAGYGDQRELELLVEAGFTPVEAIHIATQNGAQYLGRTALIGSVAVGKQADLVVIDGDPAKNISDIRKTEVVYRNGIGYSSAKLFGAVRGLDGVN
jgi:imidazolonepropionase-like amidohydrolase